MSLFTASTWLVIASISYSFYSQEQAKKAQKKAKEEADAKADKAKGFGFTEEGQAAAIPVAYGRAKVGGTRVHFKVKSDYSFAEAGANTAVFESKRIATGLAPNVWRLVNSNANWTGTWSYVASSVAIFNSAPGWYVTKEEIAGWKIPDRVDSEDGGTSYTAPSVDFVFCTFKGGSDTTTKPTGSLAALGFSFPEKTGTVSVLNTSVGGSKNEFFFLQQAICQGGINNVYSVEVNKKPYTYEPYSNGARFHVYLNGSVADPLMSANDATRINSRFTGVTYATCAFRLNRDDPQYNGTPEVLFYIEGNKIKYINKVSGVYSLSSDKVYSNNSALVLLDYLLSTGYGKKISVDDIDLESFYKAAKICNIVVRTDVVKQGTLPVAKGGTKNIALYEANLVLDSAANSRENIQKILETMSYGALVWTEGKYRLNLPYAFVYSAALTYAVDDIVQVSDGTTPRLFRALQTATNKNPLTQTSYWIEDVIDSSVRHITDNDIVGGSEILISWPDASTKLNFCTIRFLNEEKDFSEDTISWPEKTPQDITDVVYTTYLTEDNGISLESEVFEAGCVTPFHAKARAEQRVRSSRAEVIYTLKLTSKSFSLEPGDLFGMSSDLYSIPYSLLRVASIETEAGGIVKITAGTFDANLLAWNIDDTFVSPDVDVFENNSLSQARNLKISVGIVNDKTSNYKLTWEAASDNRVTRYVVKYTTTALANVTSTTTWTDLIITSSLSFELPALDGTFTFTVVSMNAMGKTASFKNYAEGSFWPLLQYQVSSAFLEGFDSLNAILSNDSHVLFANSAGVVGTYAGSGTEIQLYSGSTALTYDGVGTTNGTWKVIAPAGFQTNIVAGAITAKSGSTTSAVAANASGMSNSITSGSIVFVITGTTISGATFTISKQQSFSKSTSGFDAVYYFIDKTAEIFYKDAASATLEGIYSSVTVTGKRVLGTTTSTYGTVSYQANNGTESAKASSQTITPTSTSGVSFYTIRMYDTDNTTLLDTERVEVIFKGLKGSSALSVIMGRPTASIPSYADGTPISYTNTGTPIYVYEGNSRLVYDGVGTDNGTWKILSYSPTNITVSTSIVDSGDFVTIGDHSAITAETATIIYNISGKTSEAIPFTLETTQTFVKARRGETVVEAYLSNSAPVFQTDADGNISTYADTGTTISVLEGNTKLTFDGIGTSVGKWKAIPSGISITPAAANTYTLVNSKDANVPTASAMTADNATITFAITGQTSTGAAFSLTKTQTFTKNKQGITGKKSARVQIYKWSTTQPAQPVGNSTFTWATQTNASYDSGDGWSVTVPSNDGTPLLKLWTAIKTLEVANNVSTTSIAWAGTTVAAISQNGQAGVHAATASLYKWALTIPAGPTGSNTYTWSSGTFNSSVGDTNYNNGWSQTPLTATAGYTLWEASVAITDSAASASTTIVWSTAAIFPISYAGGNGTNGTNGTNGNPGNSFVSCYANIPVANEITGSANITTSGDRVPPTGGQSAASWGYNVGWSLTAPLVTNDNRLWQSDGIYNPNTAQTVWTTPYWSSLKVGSLSAITVNTGALNVSSTISSANGNFSVNENGAVTIRDSSGASRLEVTNGQIKVVYAGQTRVKIGDLSY